MSNPDSATRSRLAIIVALYAAGLLFIGLLRYWQLHLETPPALTAHATLLYIALTIVIAVILIRAGVPFHRLGFAVPIRPARALGLAVAGIAVLQVSGWLLAPVWEWLFGAGRDLGRFSDITDSPTALVRLMALSWSVAAFGEELAFRILLMRSVAFLLGNGRSALGIALIVQAVVFGLIHAYQGPTGIAGSTINGLVFGALVMAGRGSIWPAALAHGGNNTIGILRLYLGA